MKKLVRYLLKLENSGYEEPVYQKYRAEIVSQNSKMVQMTSLIGSIIMTILTITSCFMGSVSRVRPLYFTAAVLFIGIHILVGVLGRKSSAASLLCNYGFLATAFFFAIGLDIIQGNVTATTVCVLLVALPLLIVDRPSHEFLFFTVASVIFMYESVYIKQSPKASIDVLNALSFLLVGSFLGYKHNQMVLRNIIGHDQLRIQRDMDTLTSLYNKGAMEKKVIETIDLEHSTASIIVIDMDNFKFVNDTYGHHTGDELLQKMGVMLKAIVEPGILVSRFGGDEFVVFLHDVDQRDALQKKAEQIIRGVEQIRLDIDDSYRAHVCMGIATYPADGSQYEELFTNADTAMYHIKRNGKNGFAFYEANKKIKILVVDDVELNRAILVRMLEQDYDILEAENGRQALEVLEHNTDIVMVITDIQMPAMDGIELIQQIRAKKEWNHLAIIANTQYGDLEQEEQIWALGVDDFVYKAAAMKVIQTRIKNVLRVRDIR